MFNVARYGIGNPFAQNPFAQNPFVQLTGGVPLHPAAGGINPFFHAAGLGLINPLGIQPGVFSVHPQPWFGQINAQQPFQAPTGFGPTVSPLANPILAQLCGWYPGMSPINPNIGQSAGGQFGGPVPGGYGQTGFGGIGSTTQQPQLYNQGIVVDPTLAALCAQQLNPLAQQLPIRPFMNVGGINPIAGGQWIDPYSAALIQAQLVSQLAANPLYQLSRQVTGVPETGLPFGGLGQGLQQGFVNTPFGI